LVIGTRSARLSPSGQVEPQVPPSSEYGGRSLGGDHEGRGGYVWPRSTWPCALICSPRSHGDELVAHAHE
jgi:hypothetical protein